MNSVRQAACAEGCRAQGYSEQAWRRFFSLVRFPRCSYLGVGGDEFTGPGGAWHGWWLLP
jgi:hypothetical protein